MMVFIDPAEEIRQMIEDEGMERDEAMAKVRADLQSRQAVRAKGDSGPSKKPMHLRWTPRAAANGNLASRTAPRRTRAPRKSMT